MHVAARARLVLARRPWIYWSVVAAFATLAAMTVHGEMATISAERDRWGTTRTVLIASRPHEPGDPITAHAADAAGGTHSPTEPSRRSRTAPSSDSASPMARC